MKKGFRLLPVSLLLAAISYSSITFAINAANNWTFTLGGGYDRFAQKRNIDNTGVTFGSLGYNFTDQLGLEALLGFFTTSSHQPQDNNRQINGTMFALDGIYRFHAYRCFQTYVLAGPGILGMNPNGNDAHAQGNVNAGVGTQYFFSDKIALRLELRDFYTFIGGKNDVFINGGVSFLF